MWFLFLSFHLSMTNFSVALLTWEETAENHCPFVILLHFIMLNFPSIANRKLSHVCMFASSDTLVRFSFSLSFLFFLFCQSVCVTFAAVFLYLTVVYWPQDFPDIQPNVIRASWRTDIEVMLFKKKKKKLKA